MKKTLFARLLDILYPPKCPFCGRLTGSIEEICSACWPLLPRTTHAGARQTGEFFDFCLSPLYYTGIAREAVLRYKFGGRASYAAAFASLMADTIRDHTIQPLDAVTWVPLHPRRRRTRGYDQAELLARALAKELGLPCRATLKKIRSRKVQSSLGEPSQRRANVSGCYKALGSYKGKHLLLVDDVITSGATLSECTRMLMMAGAAEVDCVTLTRRRD